ncbi:MAG: DnaD domain protein [Firmicutes bacterium]|nr:DnaD domain protein [Bacillota bacterium]
METTGQARTVKKYKKGNITAAFGTDLFAQGFTSIPNLLLKLYKQLGITDSEMMLIIQLFRFRTEEKNYFPTTPLLMAMLSGSEEQVAGDLENLINKQLIIITDFFDAERRLVLKGYDFEPLFEKLSEVWACARVKEHERIRKMLEKENNAAVNLYNSFEKEFGRPLSPMEVEQINLWSGKLNPHMVLEALRKAVLMGKHNFKYIDSILLEWEKNNLQSPGEVAEYDRRFKDKRSGAKKSSRGQENKKSMFQSLYRS